MAAPVWSGLVLAPSPHRREGPGEGLNQPCPHNEDLGFRSAMGERQVKNHPRKDAPGLLGSTLTRRDFVTKGALLARSARSLPTILAPSSTARTTTKSGPKTQKILPS